MIRISGDESVRGEFNQLADGRLVCGLPERLVLVANHQVSGLMLVVLLGFAVGFSVRVFACSP